MKVVCCKNCGAKYQLDDNEDESTYECSSCAGDLEIVENYPSNLNRNESNLYSDSSKEDSYITQCKDCGLKYKINGNENILDYECESCGGPLRYLDPDLNKELEAYLEEHGDQQFKKVKPPKEEYTKEKFNTIAAKSIKSLPDKIESFFSEDQIYKLAEEEDEKEVPDESTVKTARTEIPKSVLSKFQKEFEVPKTSDYESLKNFIKQRFYNNMKEYYDFDETPKTTTSTFKKITDKLSIKEPTVHLEIETEETTNSTIKNRNINYSHLGIGIGIILFIVGTIEIFTINKGYGIASVIIGVIVLCLSIYKTKDDVATEKRSKVIRERLLTLPEDYYVLYDVKVPRANSGINHLVVGPSGIYAIVTQKYNPKIKLESENENKNLINLQEIDEERMEEVITPGNSKLEFKYTTKQTKFSQDNKIKQKALKLGENLITFLNENDIKNCFVEPLVGFVNGEVVVINMPLTDEDLFIDELLHEIKYDPLKLDPVTVDKCAALLSKYAADCSTEI